MRLKRMRDALLLAPVAALALTGVPYTAEADPPSVPPGQAKKGGGDFCPPGLAKKNTHCMPPGQHKKYHRGDYIRDWERFAPLDYDRYGLPAPGPDRRYIRSGNDAYLIAEGTMRVLEAISLLGAAAD